MFLFLHLHISPWDLSGTVSCSSLGWLAVCRSPPTQKSNIHYQQALMQLWMLMASSTKAGMWGGLFVRGWGICWSAKCFWAMLCALRWGVSIGKRNHSLFLTISFNCWIRNGRIRSVVQFCYISSRLVYSHTALCKRWSGLKPDSLFYIRNKIN